MSYLNPLRLHFSGRFQASVSTVNNDVTHFNNATFKPEYQQFKVGKEWNGWWNPTGDAVWRLLGCTVTSAFDPQGRAVAAKDPVLKMVVADSDDSAPAKIVDLDPQQQMVSTIFGLRVRIADAGGNTLVSGSMDPAPFTGIWMRAQGKSGDMAMGACFQSVLRDVTWGDIKGSPFLQALKKGSPDNLLSIKFNVDAFNMDVKNPQFCRGRLVGTIGPASLAEPALFTLGRQFMAVFPPQNPMVPSGGINNFTATVDEKGGKVLLDLGNALPTDAATGAMFDVGKLTLKAQHQDPDASGGSVWRDIGDIPYTEAGFYTTKGGVVALPADRRLTAAELKGIRAGGLALFAAVGKAKPVIAIQEPPNGVHVRMDSFVFRLAPRQPEVAPRDGQPYWTARTRLHATRYGQPYADARIIAFQDQSWLQGGAGEPPVSVPESVLQFPGLLVAGADGTVDLDISVVQEPGSPRGYIDGQVYGIRCALEETLAFGAKYPFAVWDLISVLVFDAFRSAQPPAWFGPQDGCLQPIFQQYANLYPVMNRFLNLGHYEEVAGYVRMLTFAFGLPDTDPNAMPVTRDLSPARRAAILQWLTHPGPDGKPLLGKAPGVRAGKVRVAALKAVEVPRKRLASDVARGGKSGAHDRLKLFHR